MITGQGAVAVLFCWVMRHRHYGVGPPIYGLNDVRREMSIPHNYTPQGVWNPEGRSGLEGVPENLEIFIQELYVLLHYMQFVEVHNA